MTAAPLPQEEYARLLELARFHILDTGPEVAFDRVTRLASRLLNVPLALINFVDQHRLWNKSAVGLDAGELPRSQSFCAWTVLNDGPLVVPDTAADPRFRNNPLVTGEPHIQTYAGAPLLTSGGHRIGTLCVMDDAPHPLSPEDVAVLQDLAAMVVSELELRAMTAELRREVDAQTRVTAELRATLAQAKVLEGVSSLLDMPLTPEEATLAAAALIGEATETDWTGLVTYRGGEMTVQVAYHHPQLDPALHEVAARLPELPGGVTRSLRGSRDPLYLEDYARHPAALPEAVRAGVRAAAWVPLGGRGESSYLLLSFRSSRNPVRTWRSSDRALLEAAGRSVRSALDRHTALEVSEQRAREDALTGVPNRRAFDEDLARRVEQDQPFTLAVIDLDGLKAVNDTEGHAQGDRLLRVFAGTLAAQYGNEATVYRLGGDEFALLSSEPGPEDVNENVDVAVLAARQLTVTPVGASVGVVLSAEVPGGPEELLSTADSRMYAIKSGRRQARAERAATAS